MCAEAKLPTDKTLATRCPLVIELQPCAADQQEHAIVSYHLEDSLVSNEVTLDELPKVIRAAQDALAGPGEGISDQEIRLELWAYDAPVR